jgi:hypothetical protein
MHVCVSIVLHIFCVLFLHLFYFISLRSYFSNEKIKVVRINNGGEFSGKDFE